MFNAVTSTMAAPAALAASPAVKPASKYVKTAYETVALPAAKTANFV